MIALYEQFLTKRQRTIQMNKLRGKQFRISPTTKLVQKQIKATTQFNNPIKQNLLRLKYKAKKGLV